MIAVSAARRTQDEIIRLLLVGVKGNLSYLGLLVGLTLLGVDQHIALSVSGFAAVRMFVLNKYYIFEDRHLPSPWQGGRRLILYGGISVSGSLIALGNNVAKASKVT